MMKEEFHLFRCHFFSRVVTAGAKKAWGGYERVWDWVIRVTPAESIVPWVVRWHPVCSLSYCYRPRGQFSFQPFLLV